MPFKKLSDEEWSVIVEGETAPPATEIIPQTLGESIDTGLRGKFVSKTPTPETQKAVAIQRAIESRMGKPGEIGTFPEEKFTTLENVAGVISALPAALGGQMTMLQTKQALGLPLTNVERSTLIKAEGLVQGMSFGAGEALAKRLGVTPKSSEEVEATSAEALSPFTPVIGSVLSPANIVGGSTIKPGMGVWKLSREGVKMGSTLGGISMGSQALAEDEPTAEEVALATGEGMLKGGLLGGALLPIGVKAPGVIKAGAKKSGDVAAKAAVRTLPENIVPASVAARGETVIQQEINAKNVNRLADVINPSGNADLASWRGAVDSGQLPRTLEMIRREGQPSTLKEFQDLAAKSEESLGKAVDDIVNQDPYAKIDTAPIQARISEKARSLPLGNAAERVINMIEREPAFSRPMTLKEALAAQRQLNSEMTSMLQKAEWSEASAQANPSYIAKDIVRRELSKGIDAELKRITGTDSNPYRDWGAVHELNTSLQKRYNALQTVAEVGKGQGILGKITSPSGQGTRLPGKTDVGMRVVGALSGPEIKRIDRQVARIFETVKPAEEIPTEASVQTRMDVSKQKRGEDYEALKAAEKQRIYEGTKAREAEAQRNLRLGTPASKQLEQAAKEREAQALLEYEQKKLAEAERQAKLRSMTPISKSLEEGLTRREGEALAAYEARKLAEAERQASMRKGTAETFAGGAPAVEQRLYGTIREQVDKKLSGLDEATKRAVADKIFADPSVKATMDAGGFPSNREIQGAIEGLSAEPTINDQIKAALAKGKKKK